MFYIYIRENKEIIMNQQPIKNDIIIKPMIEVLYPLASGTADNINNPHTLYLPAKEASYSSFYNLCQICISSIFNISRQSIIKRLRRSLESDFQSRSLTAS